MTGEHVSDDGTDASDGTLRCDGGTDASTETGADATAEAGDPDERVVSLLGFDVVVEESFVTFPWRAGMKRAPVAFLAVFALVTFFAMLGGFGQGSIGDRIALLGLFTYNFHGIDAAAGTIPELFAPIVQPLSDVPVLWRWLRGLFTVGPQHANPLHIVDIVLGKTGTIGHTNLAARSSGEIPLPVYYAIPPVVLTAAGYEFALRYWEDVITDSPLEVVRYGIAIAVGYVVTLLVGTVFFTVVMTSPLAGQAFVVLPDRYMTVIFGFGYPAVFGSLGAALVYVQRGPEAAADGSEREDGTAASAE